MKRTGRCSSEVFRYAASAVPFFILLNCIDISWNMDYNTFSILEKTNIIKIKLEMGYSLSL